MSRIASEIKQTQPFRSLGHEGVASILRTASDVARSYDPIFGTEDLTLKQYNVLRILRGAGGPLATMEISDRLLERTPGITRLVDRLEKKGLVSRLRSDSDRRQVYCELTNKGRQKLAKLDEAVDEQDQNVLMRLTDAEKKQLIKLLSKVRDSLSD